MARKIFFNGKIKTSFNWFFICKTQQKNILYNFAELSVREQRFLYLNWMILEMTQAQAHHNFMLHLCTTWNGKSNNTIRTHFWNVNCAIDLNKLSNRDFISAYGFVNVY